MKSEELIIDGVRVDMSPDTRIVLNFKSNLLGDISKITASNSQTISLPKTIRNRGIFDHATTPARNSTFPYQRHAAEYYKNGVKIISDANAVLLSASDNYEIALYWGEMTRFQSWTESGAKLNDLSFDNLTQIWRTDGTRTYCVDGDTPTDPDPYIDDSYFINADYDCGLGSMDTIPASIKAQIWLHKFVSVRMILQKIMDDSGITFEFPSGYMSRPGYNLRGLFRSVAVALTTRKTSESAVRHGSNIGSNTSKGWCYYLVGVTFSLPTSTYYSTEIKRQNFNIWGEEATCTVIKNKYAGRVKLVVILIVTTSCSQIGYTPDTRLKLFYNGGVLRTADPVKSEYLYKSGGRHYYSQTFSKTFEFDAVEGAEIAIGFDLRDGYKFHSLSNSGSIDLTPPAAESNISLGENFKAKGNFPDVSQLDFVKAICGLFGLYVVPSGEADKIKFATLDLLTANKSRAVDWSGKLVRDSVDEDDPREIKYSFGDYARRNWFKYKDDKDVATSGDAALTIDNESLEPEKDIITLPFSPSEEKSTTHTGSGSSTAQNVNLAVIPHYELDDDGNPQDVAVSPRLVCMRGEGGNEAIARFVPISFANMISLYYGRLAALLDAAVVIKERFRLTEFDLLKLDYTRPVYLKQYGRFYAIISVQTAEDYCNVELLQLPEASPDLLGILYSTNNGSTWVPNCPTGWTGTLKVKTTPGQTLSEDNIGEIGSRAGSSGTPRRMDLTDCQFISDSVGVVNKEIDADNHTYNLDNVRYINFPNGIRSFSRKAFYYAHNILGFVFPDTVDTFAWQSFEYCYALRSVEFPASVTSIGDVAFGHCYDLTTIRFHGTTPPEINYSAFHSAGSDYTSATPKQIFVPSGTRAAYYAQPGIARIVDDFGFTIVEY